MNAKTRILNFLSQHDWAYPNPELTVEELTNMTETIPSTTTILAEVLGITQAELVKKIQQGNITRQQVITCIK